MADMETWRVLATSNLLLNFILVTAIAEKPASLRSGVGEGNKVLVAFVAIYSYSLFVSCYNNNNIEFLVLSQSLISFKNEVTYDNCSDN